MSTEKQIEANRANAQHSTGPTSAAGKAKVATNRLTHGLNANPETLFAAHPDQEDACRTLAQKLRKVCQPNTAIEDETFQIYAWSMFQAKCAEPTETSKCSAPCSKAVPSTIPRSGKLIKTNPFPALQLHR